MSSQRYSGSPKYLETPLSMLTTLDLPDSAIPIASNGVASRVERIGRLYGFKSMSAVIAAIRRPSAGPH
jgi:hypothetical protein